MSKFVILGFFGVKMIHFKNGLFQVFSGHFRDIFVKLFILFEFFQKLFLSTCTITGRTVILAHMESVHH